jgi:hypothetical protein
MTNLVVAKNPEAARMTGTHSGSGSLFGGFGPDIWLSKEIRMNKVASTTWFSIAMLIAIILVAFVALR